MKTTRRKRTNAQVKARRIANRIHGLPDSLPMTKGIAHALIVYAIELSAKLREPGQHPPGPLTRTGVNVLRALIKFASKTTGNCFPSYAAIAKEARCAASTVGLAIIVLEELGVIKVINRTRVDRGKNLTTSNAYTFRPMVPLTESRRGIQYNKDSSTLMQPPVAARPVDNGDNPDRKRLEQCFQRWGAAVYAPGDRMTV